MISVDFFKFAPRLSVAVGSCPRSLAGHLSEVRSPQAGTCGYRGLDADIGSCPWPSLINTATTGHRTHEPLCFVGRFLFRPLGDAAVKAF